MKNKCRKLIFLLFSSSRVDLFVKKQNCRNLSLIENGFYFPEEINNSVHDHQHGRCDVMCKPAMQFPLNMSSDIPIFIKNSATPYIVGPILLGFVASETTCYWSPCEKGYTKKIKNNVWQRQNVRWRKTRKRNREATSDNSKNALIVSDTLWAHL